MTPDDAAVPRLRRDPDPAQTSGRKVLIGVAIFFLVLVGFVLTLVFTIGEHNNGVVLPPGSSVHPTPTSTPSPSRPFFAIDAASGANTYIGTDATYSSHSKNRPAVAVGVASDGRTAYFAVPLPGCRTRIDQMHSGKAIRNKPVGVINGHVLAFPIAVSPDGKHLALVMKRSAAGRVCTNREVVGTVDLPGLRAHVVRDVVAGSTPSVTWDPDSGRVVVHDATLDDPQPTFWWHGKLATVSAGAIRAVGPDGLGATLATGLPRYVRTVSVDPTGDKLLVSGGLQVTREPGDISSYTTYVWSDGVSSRVPGEWIDPAW